jgi:hypothetical protein
LVVLLRVSDNWFWFSAGSQGLQESMRSLVDVQAASNMLLAGSSDSDEDGEENAESDIHRSARELPVTSHAVVAIQQLLEAIDDTAADVAVEGERER